MQVPERGFENIALIVELCNCGVTLAIVELFQKWVNLMQGEKHQLLDRVLSKRENTVSKMHEFYNMLLFTKRRLRTV